MLNNYSIFINVVKTMKQVECSVQTLEAWLFLNHISTLMCYRIYNLLRKKYTSVGIMKEYLANIRVGNIGRGWNLEPLTKGEKQALKALGITKNEELRVKKDL